jgi:hypothetical protein
VDEARHFEALAGNAMLQEEAAGVAGVWRLEEAGDEWDVVDGVESDDFGAGSDGWIDRAAGDESIRPPQGEFD